ncbi:MAG TPA: twin-arginine translocation signal domain-containing protein [Pyrinomonadaceae bacterium]|jgi:hypothetical protein|nr:twin-arginine translocation signal domain-containing protein [Pyrinomonadaceae bacterium]
MVTSRRDFIKKSSLIALAAGVPLSRLERTAASQGEVPSVASGLNKTAFEAQLNTIFLIHDGASRVGIKLVDVTDLPRWGATTQREAFSLLFRGDRATALKQNTYLIEHETLGLFSFLIVPVMRRQKSAVYYEAIINRLNP